MVTHMPKISPLIDTRILRPSETALALGLATEMELLRLKTIARLYARGLPPDVAWDDLLQEAITRVLVGSRRQPEGVTVVAFLAGVMRSLKAEHWRRVLNGPGRPNTVRIGDVTDDSHEVFLADPAPGPERSLSARQELTAIQRLFAADPVALRIIAGLGEGLAAEQIRLAAGLSKVDYDSARRRMRRVLLREGLTCEPK
jgi:DNA-directed RNA polymerase specialized sigma24 family protein